MTTVQLLGYSASISASPGDRVDFKVSGDQPYQARLVELLGVDTNDTVTKTPIKSDFEGEYLASPQALTPGSYAEVSCGAGERLDGLHFQVWAQPTLHKADEPQVIASFVGTFGVVGLQVIEERVELTLDRGDNGGVADAAPGPQQLVVAPSAIRLGAWHHITAIVDFESGRCHLAVEVDAPWPAAQHSVSAEGRAVDSRSVPGPLRSLTSIRFAAGFNFGSERAGGFFNGRLADPVLFNADSGDTAFVSRSPSEAIAAWDFSADPDSLRVADVGPRQWHGTLINRPTRAVVGHRWRAGDPVDYAQRPNLWNAIHFHQDDLGDAGWSTAFTHHVPEDTPSGIYAAELSTHGGATEYIPFYVVARRPQARVLFLAPTNTYLAYANEHLSFGERGQAHEKLMSEPILLNSRDRYVHEHPELGLSIYDTHADGSGVVHSSWNRPILNFDPDYRTWLSAGRRHFAADFYITGWLRAIGVPFDVATDEDLDARGTELLSGYDVVITGTHPEYPTIGELDSLAEYAKSGGCLMYLGGNGFYWVTTYDKDNSRILEVRRGCAGQRNWSSHPAETYHGSVHTLGGINIHAGRDSRQLWGVTSAACGWGPASAYERTERSYDEDVAFVFDGIDTATIGTNGLSLGGAAGDEVDSVDFANGTPANAIVLLSARLGPNYYPFTETVMGVEAEQNGPFNDRVRSDVVLMPTGVDAGAVFSASSICWAGGMAFADYRNDVARLTENVLRWMLAGGARERTQHGERSTCGIDTQTEGTM